VTNSAYEEGGEPHRNNPGDEPEAAPAVSQGRQRTQAKLDCSVAAAISLIARSISTAPRRTVQTARGEPPGLAVWAFGTGRVSIAGLPVNVLAYVRQGTPLVTNVTGDRWVPKRPRIGSVSFLPHGQPTEWLVDGAFEAVHVYVAPSAVREFAENHLETGSKPVIADFFAIHDPWLEGYFRMLMSEYDTFFNGEASTDSLLLSETQHALVRHLVRWHSSVANQASAAFDRPLRVNPLRPVVLRRVQEFIDANLACEVTLRALADLAAMSVDHFLRSFRVGTGTTPYRYVLDQRLERAALLLKTSGAPISAVAAQCGFRDSNYFSVKFHSHFGVRPSDFRKGFSKGL
jgi:AraC family transcriptional regulator